MSGGSGKKIVGVGSAPGMSTTLSQGVIANGFLFVAGQIGIERETGALREGIAAQARQALENMKAVLDAAGVPLQNVVRVGVYYLDNTHSKIVQEIYKEFFPSEPPARTSVQAAPAKNALIEFDCIAVIPQS
ncbi:MAG TPA: Rid family hydrolase [Nitrososphaerales archaeon]|nr:Rid family hydrolase [Nitrososphaerales archaeon]